MVQPLGWTFFFLGLAVGKNEKLGVDGLALKLVKDY
jgi:hypothetical protein